MKLGIDRIQKYGLESLVILFSIILSFYIEGQRDLAEKKRLKHTKFLLNYENQLNIFYVDPLTKVCNPKICKAVINDVLIYADGSPHFNKKGAYILNDLWKENIPKIIKSKK